MTILVDQEVEIKLRDLAVFGHLGKSRGSLTGMDSFYLSLVWKSLM